MTDIDSEPLPDTDELNHYKRPYTPMKKQRGQLEKEYLLIVWKGTI